MAAFPEHVPSSLGCADGEVSNTSQAAIVAPLSYFAIAVPHRRARVFALSEEPTANFCYPCAALVQWGPVREGIVDPSVKFELVINLKTAKAPSHRSSWWEPVSKPTNAMVGGCPRAASGHAAAPPSSVMKLRRCS